MKKVVIALGLSMLFIMCANPKKKIQIHKL